MERNGTGKKQGVKKLETTHQVWRLFHRPVVVHASMHSTVWTEHMVSSVRQVTRTVPAGWRYPTPNCERTWLSGLQRKSDPSTAETKNAHRQTLVAATMPDCWWSSDDVGMKIRSLECQCRLVARGSDKTSLGQRPAAKCKLCRLTEDPWQW